MDPNDPSDFLTPLLCDPTLSCNRSSSFLGHFLASEREEDPFLGDVGRMNRHTLDAGSGVGKTAFAFTGQGGMRTESEEAGFDRKSLHSHEVTLRSRGDFTDATRTHQPATVLACLTEKTSPWSIPLAPLREEDERSQSPGTIMNSVFADYGNPPTSEPNNFLDYHHQQIDYRPPNPGTIMDSMYPAYGAFSNDLSQVLPASNPDPCVVPTLKVPMDAQRGGREDWSGYVERITREDITQWHEDFFGSVWGESVLTPALGEGVVWDPSLALDPGEYSVTRMMPDWSWTDVEGKLVDPGSGGGGDAENCGREVDEQGRYGSVDSMVQTQHEEEVARVAEMKDRGGQVSSLTQNRRKVRVGRHGGQGCGPARQGTSAKKSISGAMRNAEVIKRKKRWHPRQRKDSAGKSKMKLVQASRQSGVTRSKDRSIGTKVPLHVLLPGPHKESVDSTQVTLLSNPVIMPKWKRGRPRKVRALNEDGSEILDNKVKFAVFCPKPFCSEYFTKPSEYDKHNQDVHPGGNSPWPYTCDPCKIVLTTLISWRRHQQQHNT